MIANKMYTTLCGMLPESDNYYLAGHPYYSVKLWFLEGGLKK